MLKKINFLENCINLFKYNLFFLEKQNLHICESFIEKILDLKKKKNYHGMVDINYESRNVRKIVFGELYEIGKIFELIEIRTDEKHEKDLKEKIKKFKENIEITKSCYDKLIFKFLEDFKFIIENKKTHNLDKEKIHRELEILTKALKQSEMELKEFLKFIIQITNKNHENRFNEFQKSEIELLKYLLKKGK